MLRKLKVQPRIAAGLMQVGGLASISVGAGMLNLAAGFIAAGVSAVVFGVSLERGDS